MRSSRIERIAPRLETAVYEITSDETDEPSELLRDLKSFEIAASLKLDLRQAEAELARLRQSTPTTEPDLRALVSKWREIAARPNRPTGFLLCADELDAILSRLPVSSPDRWHPIATAPKDGTPFIAANTMDAFRAFYDIEDEVWVCEDDGKWFGQLQYPPTHWMPLPAAPVPDDPDKEE